MLNSALDRIDTSFNSYNSLVSLYSSHKERLFEHINVELMSWFAANNSSALGAVLYLLKKQLNTVTINAGCADSILHKNGFLSFFGEDKGIDTHNTTIGYKELSPTDHLYFNEYVMGELLNKSCFPQMSQPLKKKIGEAIYEIFVNTEIHSESEKVFTCGQYFPQNKTLEFMITDIGIGIQEKVNRTFNSNLTALAAINWAMTDTHTTKSVPGGIGLAILKEFIIKNGGNLTVVSGDGFWQMRAGMVSEHILVTPFPGTSVNIYVKTDDSKSYSLVSENTGNIF